MLSNGLNIRKKSQPETKSSRPVASLFDEEQQDDQSTTSGRRRNTVPTSPSIITPVTVEDESIYDYDGVYDSMKSGEREALKMMELDKKERKPKYMQNLFEMAEVRKQDRLRAEDVKLQREREQEGDEFADKEKFVTGAYRAQQEEARRLQKLEDEKEAALRRQAGGLSAFQQNLMSEDIRKHEAAVQASLSVKDAQIGADPSTELDQTRAEADRIKAAEAKLGHKVAVNDDNQVIDHRELLTAGLNRVGKSDKHLRTEELAKKSRPVFSQRERDDRQAQIDRQQRVMKAQLEESRKRQASDIERQEAVLKMQAKRTKTDADVSSAKERYLARKRAEAEAATKASAETT